MLVFVPYEKFMAESNEKELKIYELGYHLVPELAESAVAEEVGFLNTLIFDTLGGVEIASEMPKPFELAYPMEKRIGGRIEKYTRAHFGWIKFELSQDKLKDLEKALKDDSKIIRFLVIKTVRENTMLVKKISSRPSEASKKKDLAEPAMTEEELDKTIEELVIE